MIDNFRPLAIATSAIADAVGRGPLDQATVMQIFGDDAVAYGSPCRITAFGARGTGESLTLATIAWLEDARRILDGAAVRERAA